MKIVTYCLFLFGTAVASVHAAQFPMKCRIAVIKDSCPHTEAGFFTDSEVMKPCFKIGVVSTVEQDGKKKVEFIQGLTGAEPSTVEVGEHTDYREIADEQKLKLSMLKDMGVCE